MTVILTRQSKMARAFRCILRLLHAAQRQPADQRLLRCPFHLIQELLQFLRVYLFLPRLHGITEIIDKKAETVHLFRIRIIMGPVNKRRLKPVKVLCYRLIGQQHKIFNQLSSRIPFIRLYLQRMPGLIQDYFTFGELKTIAPLRRRLSLITEDK